MGISLAFMSTNARDSVGKVLVTVPALSLTFVFTNTLHPPGTRPTASSFRFQSRAFSAVLLRAG